MLTLARLAIALNPRVYGAFSRLPWASAGPALGPGNRGQFCANQGRFLGRPGRLPPT